MWEGVRGQAGIAALISRGRIMHEKAPCGLTQRAKVIVSHVILRLQANKQRFNAVSDHLHALRHGARYRPGQQARCQFH